MGQHHQILVIAKVGHRYRVLAAVHHRWCYGTIENINNCWRFLKMMENPENQRLARHEITAAARHDANWWTKLEEMVDADWWTKEKRMVEETHDITEQMPFPFLMTCLVLAAGFEPRVHPTISCISRVAPTDMGTSSSESENRDGFTIIDITALDKPTYCFTQWDENLHGATGRGGCDTPITGEEYLRYPDSRRAYCSSLAAWDVVDDGVLGDLWPGEGWKDREGTRSSTAAETKLDGSLQGNTTSSLSDLACQRAVEAALDDADMEEALTSVENIPSIPGRFARYMLDNPASAGRPCGARLLVRALKGGLGGENGGYLDLSHWPLLTDDDVLHVVKHGTSVNDITGIDLSNNHNVSAKCFRSLVDLCPSLTRLVSISTPSTSLSDLLGCLDISKKAYEISHSDHFRAAFGTIQGVKDLSDCPYFGALNTVTQVFYYCEPSVARPQAQLVQTGGENNDSGLDWRGGITRLKWLYNGLDAHGFNQPIVRAIPLQDAMLAPYRIADWFPQVFQMAIHHKHSHRRNKANGVCPDFAMALAVGLKVCLTTVTLGATALPLKNPKPPSILLTTFILAYRTLGGSSHCLLFRTICAGAGVRKTSSQNVDQWRRGHGLCLSLQASMQRLLPKDRA